MKWRFIFLVVVWRCFFLADSQRDVVSVEDVLQQDRNLLNLQKELVGSSGNVRTDLIFLLDESGSWPKSHFNLQKLFAELVSRFFVIDAEETRIAVVSYANSGRVQFDFTRSKDGDICNFIAELKRVTFKGGFVNPHNGLLVAFDVLKNSNATKKIVVLFSDGKKNLGQDPVPMAKELKDNGILIFCIGLKKSSKKDLINLATTKSHVYTFTNPNLIKTINEELRELNVNHKVKPLPSEICKGICDENAQCECHSGGDYKCSCLAGHTGSGYVGKCFKCPIGSYSSTTGKSKCTSCPVNSDTDTEGSTTVDQCKCAEGFVGNLKVNRPCRKIKCSGLRPPRNGVLEPPKCGRYVNDTCSFWCQHPTCPFDGTKPNCAVEQARKVQSPRVCLSSGKWSGPEMKCDDARCSKLPSIPNAKFECESDKNLIGTKCAVACADGYYLASSTNNEITCEDSGSWSEEEIECLPVNCSPLKISAKMETEPENCSTVPQLPFGTNCRLKCSNGYELFLEDGTYSEGIRICNSSALWDNENDIVTCQDSYPPDIICPIPIEKFTEPLKRSALVDWYPPSTIDNDAYPVTVKLEDPKGIKSPHSFDIGVNTLTYKATDVNGLSSTCEFTITVRDDKAPLVKFCPNDLEVTVPTNTSSQVTWQEPEFWDNSENYFVNSQTHRSGDLFATQEIHQVIYQATDLAGNSAQCQFLIKIKPYECEYRSAPLHGQIICDTNLTNQRCTVKCDDGFDFLSQPLSGYDCMVFAGHQTQWSSDVTWPDCAERSQPHVASVEGQMSVSVSDCDNIDLTDSQLDEIGDSVESILIDKSPACNNKTQCDFEIDGLPSCNPPLIQRRRRSVENDLSAVDFYFHVKFFGDQHPDDEILRDELFPGEVRKDVQETLQNLFSDDYQLPEPEFVVSDDVSFTCDVGQVLRSGICLKCPSGTYLNSSTSNCELCPLNTYQDVEASTSCTFCPLSTFTLFVGSKDSSECKAPCSPGYYSTTGFEQCLACPVGSFQDEPQKISCKICPGDLTTWSVGANAQELCTSPCLPGTFSSTGFAPCEYCPKGTYQKEEQQTECIICPEKLLTMDVGNTDVTKCQYVDSCGGDPCKNNASCIDDGDGHFKCLCSRGFIGSRCEFNDNDCNPFSCFNGGNCVDGIQDYSCRCLPGYEGQRCEIDVDECANDVCLNGGICNDLINAFHCDCAEGFAGEYCEININDCTVDSCRNGGICHDQANTFYCCCPVNFTGDFCEIAFDICHSEPCSNGGTCVIDVNDYLCLCPIGYTGLNCEIKVNYCESRPCENNGQCTSKIDNYECKCSPGYIGLNCEIQLSLDFDITFPTHDVLDFSRIYTARELYALTLSFWMKSDSDPEYHPTPISFSYKSPENQVINNALTFFNLNKFSIFLHGVEVSTDITGKSTKSKWHHFVLTWDSLNGFLKVYKDGVLELSKNGVHPGTPIWRGYLVVGQDQNSLEGGFRQINSFKGSITQLNLWDFEMTSEQVRLLYSSCGYIGNIVAWSDVRRNLQGSNVIVVEPSQFCSSKSKCGQSHQECHCHYNNIFDDTLCENELASCPPRMCRYDQQCRTTNDTHYCDCKGFTGKFCQYDVNECAFNDGNCSHDCVNTLGSYYCLCPTGFQLSNDGHNCVPLRQCIHNGLLYADTEKWTQHCEECVCNKEEIRCRKKSCAKLTCPTITIPGECCPSCLDESTACTVTPKNIFTTFDGHKMSHVDGCRYVLAQDCSGGNFSVHFETDVENPTQRRVTLAVGCTIVEIGGKESVIVDGDEVELPYMNNDVVSVTAYENMVVAISREGIIVRLFNTGLIKVSVPKNMFRKMCGLCGDFNGVEVDDMKMRNYIVANTLTEFIRDWKIETISCPTPKYQNPGRPEFGSHAGHCEITDKNWDYAQERCEALRTEPFHECYSKINPREHYELCIQDACSCDGNLCHCDAINVYVAECSKYGISITGWIGEEECTQRCKNGTVFDICGPPCRRTCNKDEDNDPRCFIDTCRAGCHCPTPTVFHAGECISESQCP